MKKMRKLIPAFCMLLLSATMLTTSTFAWFSMNKSVTVTGMQITAKSDSVYLLISGTKSTASEIQGEKGTSATLTIDSEASRVYPSAHKSFSDISDAATASNWYYQIADAPEASASTKPQVTLSDSNVGQYVLHKTVYMTVAEGSNPATNIKVSAAITSNNTATGGTKTITPVKVVVGVGANIVELDSTTTTSATVLVASLDDASVATVEIYIYYNGADAAVYTNNVANLDGANINLTFTAE